MAVNVHLSTYVFVHVSNLYLPSSQYPSPVDITKPKKIIKEEKGKKTQIIPLRMHISRPHGLLPIHRTQD